MVKRLLAVFNVFVLMLLALGTNTYATEEYKFLLCGKEAEQSQIRLKDDVYMISASCAEENLGVTVFYYNDNNKAVLSYDGSSVIAEGNSSTLYINGVAKQATKAAFIDNGEFFVPLEMTLKELGFQVKYDDKAKECNVYIASEVERLLNASEKIDGMYVSEELLSNESFEENFVLAGGWTNRVSSTVQQSDKFVRTGKYAGLVTKRPSGWASISQDVSQVLTEYGPGRYRVKGYVRTADEPCRMTIKAVVTNSEGVKTSTGTAPESMQEVNNDGWTEFDYVADLGWDMSINSAVLYCEATSNTGLTAEVQDFYVDDFSFVKLMSDDEYYSVIEKRVAEQNKEKTREEEEKMREDALNEKYASDELKTYYPRESSEILKNPYKGLIIYPGSLIFGEDSVNWGGGMGSILYHRYSWCYIEPEEGVYNWDMLDKNIELCRKNGMQLGLGIGATVNYNSATSYNQDTPEWVFEAGCRAVVEDFGNGVSIKVPDYEDPIFREKMQNMINAFCERYNDNDVIAYVDMRNYGNWGEWHFYNMPTNRALEAQRTNAEFFSYIDMFKNMRLPALSFVARPDVTKYATETLGAGVRADGLVAPAEMDKHKNMNLVENKAMAVGEWFEQYTTVYLPGGKYSYAFDTVPILFERQIREGHISCMAFLNWDAKTAYKTWKDMYDRAANYVGYWYKPVKIQHSADITKGIFKLKVKNDGVAPLFAGYEKKAVVKLALADDNNNIIDTVVLDGFDPLYWLSGEMTDCIGEYEFKNTEGAKKLLMGVFTKESKEEPDVKLGIQADMIGGWYDISSMEKSDSWNLANNKKFSAYALYADEGYGFRRPEYACDNNMNTYWANNCVNGNYLEVDFGETKNISQVTLNALENIKVKYSVQVCEGGKWKTVANEISMSTAGSVIKFRSEKCDKLRITINEDKDAVLKICELSVI